MATDLSEPIRALALPAISVQIADRQELQRLLLNGPHQIDLWLQLDQNRFKKDSLENRSLTESQQDRLSFDRLRKLQSMSDHSHGFNLSAVTDTKNNALSYTIVDTMMRLDLPEPPSPRKAYPF